MIYDLLRRLSFAVGVPSPIASTVPVLPQFIISVAPPLKPMSPPTLYEPMIVPVLRQDSMTTLGAVANLPLIL